MSVAVSQPTSETAEAAQRSLERRAFVKVAWRVLPILILAYILNYVDRTNVGIAALTMNKDVGLTASQFGTGAGLLFVGYCLFEVPSNLVLYRVGARVWIARIMVSWGLVSAAMVFVSGPWSFYALRFLLGVAEAGFFPGVAFYLSGWFPAQYRARILAWFLVAIPASSLIGAPLSGLMLRMDGMAGLAGWQWLFLLESLPCVAIGLVLPRLMTDHPKDAHWLTEAEREAVVGRIASEQRERPVSKFLPLLTDARIWLLSGVYLGFSIGSYGIQVWLPLIIKQAAFSDMAVGLLTGGPYLFAVIGMVLWAGAVDARGGRVLNVVLTCGLAAFGFLVALLSSAFLPSLLGITIALVGVNAARAVFWAIPSRFLTGAAAAGGLALINSIGTMGGFFGPAIMGWLKDATGSFTAGLGVMSGFLIVATILAASLKLVFKND